MHDRPTKLARKVSSISQAESTCRHVHVVSILRPQSLQGVTAPISSAKGITLWG